MNRSLKLSVSIVNRVPKLRRTHILSNLTWITRNLVLSNAEREEMIQAIREERKKSCS